MKKTGLLLALAAISFAACRKQQVQTPQTQSNITTADFYGSKAIRVSPAQKKTGEGLEMDYDVVIKQVGKNKYAAAMKFNGLTLNGKTVKGSKDLKIFGAVLALNTTKEDKSVPLDVLLSTTEVQSAGKKDIIEFPEFEYDGDLSYELIKSPSGTIIVNGDLTITNGAASVSIADLEIVPEKTAIKGGDVIIKEDATLTIDGKEMTTGFGISMSAADKGKCSLTHSSVLFVLPNGHTVEQDPRLAKVTVKETKDTYGYVTLTVSGDPAGAIKSLTFILDSVKGSGPSMTFLPTFYNVKQGIRRFESTKTWNEVFGSTSFKSAAEIKALLIRRGREMGVPSFTDIREQ